LPEPTSARQSAIVRKASRVPDLTEEELKRRGDAADEMFQEMKRGIAGKVANEQGWSPASLEAG
jgi:hypothetical protein